MRKDAAETRRERLRKMIEDLQRNGTGPLGKYIAAFSLTYGLTRAKILEYLETLESAGYIQLDRSNNKVLWLGSSGAEK